MQMVMGMGLGEEQFGKLSTAASCQHFSSHTHAHIRTHLTLFSLYSQSDFVCVCVREPQLENDIGIPANWENKHSDKPGQVTRP